MNNFDTDIINSLRIASNIENRIKEDNNSISQNIPNNIANLSGQSNQSSSSAAIDSNALEKAFEKALVNMQNGIVEQFKDILNNFGKEIIKTLKNDNKSSNEEAKMLKNEGMASGISEGSNSN